MEDKVQLMIDTAFSTEGIWDGVNNVLKDNIRLVLPNCFENGNRDYKKVKGYDDLPWKTKHHLDIRIEMYNDIKRV